MFGYRHFKKLYWTFIILLTGLFIGILGYVVIEGYTVGEAFYMTIITISTVGFSEIRPLSEIGRLFTAFLIIFSFGTFAYAATAVTTYVINGEFRYVLKEMRLMQQVKKLSGHTIICGYGRNGRQAVAELKAHGKPYLVIEQDKEILSELRDKQIPYIEGDATHESTLELSAIHQAFALITTLPKDADNMFVVLTARDMVSSLLIISRASQDNSDKKLRRAGADNVIMPDKIGGAHMASLVIKPDVIEFMDYVMGQGTSSVNLEEISFEALPTHLKEMSIESLHLAERCGANIVGMRKSNGEYVINPTGSTVIEKGSKIFVLGTVDQIKSFRDLSLQDKILSVNLKK